MREWFLKIPIRIRSALVSLGICLLCGYLFYDSFWFLLGVPVVFKCTYRVQRQYEQSLQRKEIEKDFLIVLNAVASGLMAGLSMENAWRGARKELRNISEKRSSIVYKGLMEKKMEEIISALDMNIPIEPLLVTFGRESGIEDIQNFAEVFSFAKRSGGRLSQIIERTVLQMREKQDVLEEIEVLITSKKLEQTIMNFIPLIMILYLRFASPDYFGSLYHNIAGWGVMSVGLGGYVSALILSRKILDIQV